MNPNEPSANFSSQNPVQYVILVMAITIGDWPVPEKHLWSSDMGSLSQLSLDLLLKVVAELCPWWGRGTTLKLIKHREVIFSDNQLRFMGCVQAKDYSSGIRNSVGNLIESSLCWGENVIFSSEVANFKFSMFRPELYSFRKWLNDAFLADHVS